MTATMQRDETDQEILELVRLTTADTWTLRLATDGLLAKRYSVVALRVALSRVVSVPAHLSTPITNRAAATLGATLAQLGM